MSDYVQRHVLKLEEYISNILSGSLVAGKFEIAAVNRFLKFKEKYEFRESELKRILKFFSLLRIPFKNDVKQMELENWQVFLIANVYCLYTSNEERLIKECVISTAGKNGKSTLIVTLALLEMLADNELNAGIAIISPTNKQSGLILKYCKEIIQNSPLIKNLFKIKHQTIENKTKDSLNTLLILTNETEKIQGTNLSATILDEIFLYDDLEIRYIAKRKSGARLNPIQFSIGTVSNKNAKGYEELFKPCEKILLNEAEDDELFIYLFLQDNEQEINDHETWRKSNPSISMIGSIDNLKKEFERIKIFPSNFEVFKTESLNYWKETGLELPFIEREVLNNAMRDNHQVPLKSNVWVGVDLSSTVDLASIALITQIDNKFYSKTINIMPNCERNFIKGNEIDLNRYFVKNTADFMQNNYNYPDSEQCVIRCLTPDLDEQLIEDILIDISNKYQVQGVYYDRYNAKSIMTKLDNRGLKCVPISQNITTLSQPLKFMEKKLISNDFFIEKNLVTKWQAGNINLYTSADGSLIKLNKNKKKLSIDAWIALNIAMVGYWLDNYDDLKNQLGKFGFI